MNSGRIKIKWKDRISKKDEFLIIRNPVSHQIIFKWKDRMSEVKDLRSHLCEFPSAVELI
jgi:hypothetical protein